MSDGVLSTFKIALLVVIYLFFFRVLRTIWAQLREPRVVVHSSPIQPTHAPPSAATQAPFAPQTTQAPASSPTIIRQVTSSHIAANRQPITNLVLQQILPVTDDSPPPIAVVANPFVVGRSRQANLPIDDSFASQRHAQLVLMDGIWQVEDLGSTNGTLLNGIKISHVTAVAKGDRLAIGNHHFEVQ